jgi:hypothetical protein
VEKDDLATFEHIVKSTTSLNILITLIEKTDHSIDMLYRILNLDAEREESEDDTHGEDKLSFEELQEVLLRKYLALEQVRPFSLTPRPLNMPRNSSRQPR